MKRSGPLRRKTPLRQSAASRSERSGRSDAVDAPKPKRRRSAGRSGPSQATRDEVIARDGGCVAASLVPEVRCLGSGHIHHVLPRSQGGGHDVSNLVLVCLGHHGWIHDHPARSYELGLLRKISAETD